jgi:hypothetical protein
MEWVEVREPRVHFVCRTSSPSVIGELDRIDRVNIESV